MGKTEKPYFNVVVTTELGNRITLKAQRVDVDWDDERNDEYEGDLAGGNFTWRIKE